MQRKVLEIRTRLLDLKRRLGEKEMPCLTLENKEVLLKARVSVRKQILLFFSEGCIIHFHILFLSTVTV